MYLIFRLMPEIYLMSQVVLYGLGHKQDRKIEYAVNSIAEQVMHLHVPVELSLNVNLLNLDGKRGAVFHPGPMHLRDTSGSHRLHLNPQLSLRVAKSALNRLCLLARCNAAGLVRNLPCAAKFLSEYLGRLSPFHGLRFVLQTAQPLEVIRRHHGLRGAGHLTEFHVQTVVPITSKVK
mgnify:CR=1 FL=1